MEEATVDSYAVIVTVEDRREQFASRMPALREHFSGCNTLISEMKLQLETLKAIAEISIELNGFSMNMLQENFTADMFYCCLESFGKSIWMASPRRIHYINHRIQIILNSIN